MRRPCPGSSVGARWLRGAGAALRGPLATPGSGSGLGLLLASGAALCPGWGRGACCGMCFCLVARGRWASAGSCCFLPLGEGKGEHWSTPWLFTWESQVGFQTLAKAAFGWPSALVEGKAGPIAHLSSLVQCVGWVGSSAPQPSLDTLLLSSEKIGLPAHSWHLCLGGTVDICNSFK